MKCHLGVILVIASIDTGADCFVHLRTGHASAPVLQLLDSCGCSCSGRGLAHTCRYAAMLPLLEEHLQ